MRTISWPGRTLTRRAGFAALAGLLASVNGLAPTATAQEIDPPPTSQVVLERTIAGDLVMAGNSNLITAGGWVPATTARADSDGDHTLICLPSRPSGRFACTDNSSSARVDIPAGAAIITARLYVVTSLSDTVGPLRVRVAGPLSDGRYTELGDGPSATPKVTEMSVSDRYGSVMRTATWDVTDIVDQQGAGDYTVADIVNKRTAAWLPVAAWSMVVAYELDSASGVELADIAPTEQHRFTRRTVSWHDGFTLEPGSPIEVGISGLAVRPQSQVFAKSFHVVAHAGPPRRENLLFDGRPLGNNTLPGSAPAGAGPTIGADPACNTVVDVLNDSVCFLGTLVASKAPGPDSYVSSADGRTPTSGSGIDMDVLRIPTRYLPAGSTRSVLSLDTDTDAMVVPVVVAASIETDDSAGLGS